MTIRLVTDSAASLPQQWVRALDIAVVDLHLVEEEGHTLSTSAATPEELTALYLDLLAEPDCTGVVSVHLSSLLSRTWQSAADAASGMGGRVLVVDSHTAGMGVGAAVAQCAWAAHRDGDEPDGLSATYELAERLCRTGTTLLAVESLESLRRGGRIGPIMALFGGALAMRPILELRGGQLGLAAKARTTGKAMQRLRGLLHEEVDRGDVLVAVHHSEASERAEQLAEDIRKETPFPQRVVVVPFDPILDWHVGPGTVGVSVTDLVDPEFHIPAVDPQGESRPGV